ncbi:UNVERIFIED_CONTAM: hypothetical protein K2H54_062237, partial [Gekko kuhli]
METYILELRPVLLVIVVSPLPVTTVLEVVKPESLPGLPPSCVAVESAAKQPAL